MSDQKLIDAVTELGKNLKPHVLVEFHQVEGFAKQLQALMDRPERGIISSQVVALLLYQSLQISDLRNDVAKLEARTYYRYGGKEE